MSATMRFRPGDLATVLERRLRNWELAQAQRPSTQVPISERAVADFITIGREVGAGGTEVAAALSKRLGWPVFGRELLQAMAESDASRARIYANMDESDAHWVDEALGLLFETRCERYAYHHRLCATILALARQAPTIFLGRGADLVLPANTGLRLQLVAPLEQRISRLQKRHGWSRATAIREARSAQRQRDEFVQHLFGGRATAAPRFDLVINTGRWSIEQVVALILAARRV